MPSSVDFGDYYTLFPDGRIWMKDHKTTRKDGVIRSWKGRWLSQRIRKADIGEGGGYLLSDLSVNGSHKTYLVHRLIAEAFIPNPENLPQVNHKDGNRSNNHFENLEWVNASDNQNHAYSMGRTRKSKLTDEQMVEIFNLRNKENLPLKIIAEIYGVNFRTISEISKGKRFVLHKEDKSHA